MSGKKQKALKFIDLFAGIGGFHIAMKDLGNVCVFASDIDKDCRDVYEKNFNHKVVGDITAVREKDVPAHDVLLAGFPCQPFSKGGHRRGFSDTRGTLFFDIERILRHHKPAYVLLENVQNLVTHDEGRTYSVILETLRDIGYTVPEEPNILSPHQFGLPALRKRIYIPAIYKHAKKLEFSFPDESKTIADGLAYTVLNPSLKIQESVTPYEKKVIKMWNEFYKGIDQKVIGFPVWFDYFKYKGSLRAFPTWKQDFITKNKDLYARNKRFIDVWAKKYDNLSWVRNTHRKFEWQAGLHAKNIYETLIQFRPSGVRVKRATYFSTLVAMNHGQIVGKVLRRLLPDEAKLLQSFPKNFKLHSDEAVAMKQLGNAVNVHVVRTVLEQLFRQ
jgi:DNA (cytosine-5)-methyltransferase 1